MSPNKYKSGDRVVSLRLSNKAGNVSKSGRGASCMVHWDGGNKDERVYLDALRPETQEDVAKRQRAERMRAWDAAKPEHSVVRVDYHHSYCQEPAITGFTVRAIDPARMRIAAQELLELADWFERKPQ